MIESKFSDFYGYPNYTGTTYYKTTSNSPCTVNPSTFTEVKLIYDSNSKKWYELSSTRQTVLATGKYFRSPSGNGKYLNLVSGVEDNSAASLNYSCSRFPDNKVMSQDLGVVGGYDTYGNDIYVSYPGEQIVVKYPINEYGGTLQQKAQRNVEGTIVAGSYMKEDLGGETPEERPFLSYPSIVKCNQDTGDFVVFSDGRIKSFKVFTSSGTFRYRFIDNITVGQGELEYPLPTGNNIEDLPTFPVKSGLLSMITPRFTTTNPSDQEIRTVMSNVWKVTSLEFFSGTTGSQSTASDGNPILFVGLWRSLANTTHFRIARVIKLEPYASESNAHVTNDFYSATLPQQGTPDEIPSISFLHKHQIDSTFTRISLLLIWPRLSSYRQFGLREIRFTYDTDWRLPENNQNLEVLDKGNHTYDGSKEFKGSIRVYSVYSKRDNTVKFISSTYDYTLNDYLVESVKAVSKAAGAGGSATALAFILKNAVPGIVKFSSGLLAGFTLSGILVGSGIVVGVVALGIALWPSSDRATIIGEINKGSYNINTGSTLTYGRWYSSNLYYVNILGAPQGIADNSKTSITRGIVVLTRTAQKAATISVGSGNRLYDGHLSISIIKPSQASDHLLNRNVILSTQELLK